MNYELIYQNLIFKSKDRIKNENEYYEIHHIIPRSIGGNDDIDNLVFLTAREHFLAHALLAKFTDEPKLKFAFFAMCNQSRSYQNRYIPPSKLYEIAKRLHSEQMSKLHTGKILSNIHIKKLRDGHKKYFDNEDNIKKSSDKLKSLWNDPNNKTFIELREKLKESKSEDHKEKCSLGLLKHYESENGIIHKSIISNSLKERWKDEDYKLKMVKLIKKKYDDMSDEDYEADCKRRKDNVTDEFREKMSVINKNNATETHKKVSCEHCNKQISRQNYAKFHGDKCTTITGIKHIHKKVNCKYCNKECSPSTLSRWHNENCKEKNNA